MTNLKEVVENKKEELRERFSLSFSNMMYIINKIPLKIHNCYLVAHSSCFFYLEISVIYI